MGVLVGAGGFCLVFSLSLVFCFFFSSLFILYVQVIVVILVLFLFQCRIYNLIGNLCLYYFSLLVTTHRAERLYKQSCLAHPNVVDIVACPRVCHAIIQ